MICRLNPIREVIKFKKALAYHQLWRKLRKQVGSGCLVCCLKLPSRWPDLLEYQWEFDFGVVELLGAVPLAKFCWDSSCLDDLNAWKPHPVTRCHLSVHLFYGTIESCVSVFLVHIVITSSTLISQPNAIVLDLGRVFLKNLQSQTYIVRKYLFLFIARCN